MSCSRAYISKWKLVQKDFCLTEATDNSGRMRIFLNRELCKLQELLGTSQEPFGTDMILNSLRGYKRLAVGESLLICARRRQDS